MKRLIIHLHLWQLLLQLLHLPSVWPCVNAVWYGHKTASPHPSCHVQRTGDRRFSLFFVFSSSIEDDSFDTTMFQHVWTPLGVEREHGLKQSRLIHQSDTAATDTILRTASHGSTSKQWMLLVPVPVGATKIFIQYQTISSQTSAYCQESLMGFITCSKATFHTLTGKGCLIDM